MRRFIFSFLATAIAVMAAAQNTLPNDTAVRTGRLDNGLTYYIRHNAQPAERAEFYLATNVGAFQETDEQDGLAHFLEHMCFNGTKNFPGKALLDYLQGIGAQFGRNINASTGLEQTTYMLNNIPVIRNGIVDSCLLIMHDYSHFVLCEQEEIDAERGVILEERRSRRTADWRMVEQTWPIYFAGTPYANCTLIGREEQLKTFKRESLVDFYTTWYQPDMQALIVVGDIDVDYVEAKIAEIFADIPAPATPTEKTNYPIPGNEEPVVGIITDPEASSSSIEVIWKSDAMPQELNSTDAGLFLRILKKCIGIVMNERLEEIKAQPDAPFVAANFALGDLCYSTSATMASAYFKDGEAVTALTALLTETERMRRHGFTAAEIERARTKIVSDLEKAAEAAPTRKNAELVRPLLNNFFDQVSYFDPATELMMTQAICSQLNPMVINMIAQKYITDENMIIIFNGPEREGLENPTEQELLDVITAVKDTEIDQIMEEGSDEPLLDPSKLEGCASGETEEGIYGSTTWTLDNGVEVVVLPTEYKNDEVLIYLIKQGGSSLIETQDLASFDGNLWTLFLRNKGVAGFTGTQLKKMLTGKNVRCNPVIDDTRHGIVATSTPKDLETAMQLVYLNFAEQRFSADEYQTGVSQLEALLPNVLKSPEFLIQKRYEETLYGNNPRQAVISEQTLIDANIATLERVYKNLFNGADEAVLYIVGNVTVEQVKPLIEKYIGSIERGTPTGYIDRHDGIVTGTVEVKEEFAMETPKSSVYQTYSMAMPCTPDAKVQLDIVAYVLRVIYVATIREAEGGTYSPSVRAEFDRVPTGQVRLTVSFPTNAESSARLAQMAKDEMSKLATEGISDDQFAQAIENLKKNIPERRITNSYWRTALREWKEDGVDYDTEYEEAVNGANKETATAFLRALLASGNFVEFIANPATE